MVQAREMQGDQSDLGARQQCRRLYALCSAHVKACATMFYYVEGFIVKEKRFFLPQRKPGVKEVGCGVAQVSYPVSVLTKICMVVCVRGCVGVGVGVAGFVKREWHRGVDLLVYCNV